MGFIDDVSRLFFQNVCGSNVAVDMLWGTSTLMLLDSTTTLHLAFATPFGQWLVWPAQRQMLFWARCLRSWHSMIWGMQQKGVASPSRLRLRICTQSPARAVSEGLWVAKFLTSKIRIGGLLLRSDTSSRQSSMAFVKQTASLASAVMDSHVTERTTCWPNLISCASVLRFSHSSKMNMSGFSRWVRRTGQRSWWNVGIKDGRLNWSHCITAFLSQMRRRTTGRHTPLSFDQALITYFVCGWNLCSTTPMVCSMATRLSLFACTSKMSKRSRLHLWNPMWMGMTMVWCGVWSLGWGFLILWQTTRCWRSRATSFRKCALLSSWSIRTFLTNTEWSCSCDACSDQRISSRRS